MCRDERKEKSKKDRRRCNRQRQVCHCVCGWWEWDVSVSWHTDTASHLQGDTETTRPLSITAAAIRGMEHTHSHTYMFEHTPTCTSSEWLQAHSQHTYDLICEWPLSHSLTHTHHQSSSLLALTYACSHRHTQGLSHKYMHLHTHWRTCRLVVVNTHKKWK